MHRTRSRLQYLHRRDAELTTCEGNTLSCTFVGVDRSGEHVALDNLVTPANSTLSHAVVRTPDIDKIVLGKSAAAAPSS